MPFFKKKQAQAQKKQVQKEPTEIIKPWQRYLEKKGQGSETIKPARPVGEVLPNLQETRRKKLKRNLIIILVPLVILLILISYYIAPISKIGTVSVSGTKVIPEQEIIDSSGIHKTDHIFKLLLRRHQIADKITSGVPGVKTAALDVDGLNHVTFKVQEYQRVGYLNLDNQYYSILSNGIILKKAVAKPVGNLPVLERFSEGKKLDLFIKTFKNLPISVQNDISEVHLTKSKVNPYQVHIYMNDKNEVIADLRTMNKKLPNYPTYAKALDKRGVIDIEVGAFAYPLNKNTKK